MHSVMPRLELREHGRPPRIDARPAAAVRGLVDVTVVLPARNEVALLGSTVSAIHAGLVERKLSFEIVVVENGSSDGTAALAHELAAAFPGLRVLARFEADYGAALAAGFAAARGSAVVSFDVDYFDMDFLDQALTALGRGDVAVVVASKRCEGAEDDRPVVRRVLTWGFTTLLHRLVDMPVSDAHGIKAFARIPLEPVIASCELRGSLFDVEMVVRAGRRGLASLEVPASVREIRPCRSPVWRRSIEGLVGALRLRAALAR